MQHQMPENMQGLEIPLMELSRGKCPIPTDEAQLCFYSIMVEMIGRGMKSKRAAQVASAEVIARFGRERLEEVGRDYGRA